MVKKRKSTVLTRTESSKKFCGQPSPLNTTEPPTLRQVIQYSYFVKNSNPDLNDYDVSKLIAKDVIEVWRSVNPRLPLYDEYYIVKKVDKACFQKTKKINWKTLSTAQQQNFEESLDRLFDISACTCHLPIRPCNDKCVKCSVENCQSQHIVCLCPPSKKVPLEEREYLKDQRAKHGPKGSFQLGSVDQEAVKTMRRAEAEIERLKRKKQAKDLPSTSTSHVVASDSSQQGDSEDEEFSPCRMPSSDYSFLKTPRYAMELIRGDVSSRLGASLANAFLLDLQAMDLLKPGLDVGQIIMDKCKIDREKKRMKEKSEKKQCESTTPLVCIGVDSKIDKDTLIYREVTGEDGQIKLKKGKGSEHHLTFTTESGKDSGTYLTHRIIPTTGATGAVLAAEVKSVLEEFQSVNSIKAVLLDNTATNTGWKSGLVTVLETNLKRRLHTIGCSLHQNELPFRAVFKFLDGSTKSPTAFSGPLGKLCVIDHQDLPQVKFRTLSGPLDDIQFPDDTLTDLSTDQRLLLEYIRGISSGTVDPRFAAWKIGPVNHARWLTLAIRLMCVWTRGVCPPELQDELYHAVKFIVEVYAVSWFEIKKDNEFSNQQQYIYNMIQRIKNQSDDIQCVALKNLEHNAFALLPENMLYSMLKSNDLAVRQAGLQKILSIRAGVPPKKRLKTITAINTDATHWSELINLSQHGICEPALTEHFSDSDLQNALENGTELKLPDLPSHSQSVERAVKLTSEASVIACGLESRHRHILAKVASRQMRPAFESKGAYDESFDDICN